MFFMNKKVILEGKKALLYLYILSGQIKQRYWIGNIFHIRNLELSTF